MDFGHSPSYFPLMGVFVYPREKVQSTYNVCSVINSKYSFFEIYKYLSPSLLLYYTLKSNLAQNQANRKTLKRPYTNDAITRGHND